MLGANIVGNTSLTCKWGRVFVTNKRYSNYCQVCGCFVGVSSRNDRWQSLWSI